MPVNNRTSFTTIGNLYDVLRILFTESVFELRRRKAELQRIRPEDAALDLYFEHATSYFRWLRRHCSEMEAFFSADGTEVVVNRYRGSHGGNALFRPIGLEIFTRIVARLTKTMSLRHAVMLAARLPRDLNEEPYTGLMWDQDSKTILNGHKVTLREILCYMIGKNGKNYPEHVLLERYRRETGNGEIVLPKKIEG